MAITGKDVLTALGIDETHVSDISLPPAERTISLRCEGVLIDLRHIARRMRGNVTDVVIPRHSIAHMIDMGKDNDERHGFNDLDEPLGSEIRLALQGLYSKLEALLPLADEA